MPNVDIFHLFINKSHSWNKYIYIFSKPTPATGVKDWPKMNHPHGPYLRIKTHPKVRDNILDEYNITVTEGIYNYPPPDLNDPGPNRGNSPVIVNIPLIVIFLSILSIR